MRARLERELAAAVRERVGGERLPFELRLAPSLRETIVAAARLDAAPDALVEHYARRLPVELIEQLALANDRPARLLWETPVTALPRLSEGLAGLRGVLGVAPPTGGSLAELYLGTLFGSCAPLVGALAHERAEMERELAAGAEAVALLDLRLSGNLLHEICHGPAVEMEGPPAPWTVLEAAALLVGARARPAHIFPDVPGEAVRGVSLFVLAGEGLARLFGLGPLVRLLAGAPMSSVLGPRPAGLLAAAGWQAWLRRRVAPFVADALDAEAWIKLADLARRPGEVIEDPLGAAPGLPDLLGEAARTPWRELPWYAEEPTAADLEMVATGVTALFQANVMAPSFQTVPCEPPGGRIFVDVERCLLHAEPRPEGVFGEPARWVFPPPLARRLAARGARIIVVAGARRARREAIAAALVDHAQGTRRLPDEHVLDFAP